MGTARNGDGMYETSLTLAVPKTAERVTYVVGVATADGSVRWISGDLRRDDVVELPWSEFAVRYAMPMHRALCEQIKE